MAENGFPRFVTSGVWALGNQYYNLYLIKGQNASALVEVGVSAVVDDVVQQLEDLGARPDYLVVTHPHPDHLTGLDGLRERFPRARVLAAPGAREFSEHPKAAEALLAEDRHIHRALESLGHLPKRSPVDAPPALNDSVLARSGDTVDLGGATLRFLEVKGHSPGNLAVHIPEADTLLLSDCFGFYYPGRRFLPLFLTGYADYIDTLNYLERFEAGYLGLGHQGPLTGAAAGGAFAEARCSAEDFLESVRGKGDDPADLVESLFHDLYRDELIINSPGNIRNCLKLLIRRCAEMLPRTAFTIVQGS